MKLYAILIVPFILLIGCSEEAPPPVNDNTVHIAGFITNAELGPVASYWRDGVYTKLVSDSSYSTVRSLAVEGTTALISANNFIPPGPTKVFLWENGTKSYIDDVFGDGPILPSHGNGQFRVWFSTFFKEWVLNKSGVSQPLIDTADSWPTSVALRGDDMYISGVAQGTEFLHDPVLYYSDQFAQCWKNDQLIFRESHRSFAWSVFLYENDIYIGGNLYDNPEPYRIACYWKNGVRVELNDGSEDAAVYSIVVADSHVYAAGTMGGHACYWKDGVVTRLPHDGTVRSGVNSMAVHNGDVHLVGYDDGYPAYWKNDVKETFEHQNKRGELRVIVVGAD